MSQEQWDEVVSRPWACQAHRRSRAHTDLGFQRPRTPKNYKGRVAAAIPDGRHQPDPQEVPKVRATRLRRFGRRIEQWHRSP